jgi:hypothetical protein
MSSYFFALHKKITGCGGPAKTPIFLIIILYLLQKLKFGIILSCFTHYFNFFFAAL